MARLGDKEFDSEWKIWFDNFIDGTFAGGGVHYKSYKREQDAKRVARIMCRKTSKDSDGRVHSRKAAVAIKNPWKINSEPEYYC